MHKHPKLLPILFDDISVITKSRRAHCLLNLLKMMMDLATSQLLPLILNFLILENYTQAKIMYSETKA